MTKIYEQNSVKYLPNLCMGFDDNSEHEEVTWSLVHAVEDFYTQNPSTFDSIFVQIIDDDIFFPHAEGWLELFVDTNIK